MPPIFDNRRLGLARKRAGLTKREVAEHVGVSPASITQYEAGRTVPKSGTMQRMALVLGCPIEYFEASNARRPAGVATSPFYRSLRATRQWERDQAEALSEHLWDLVWLLEREFELPLVQLPELGAIAPAAGRERIEQAAADLRWEWQVPEGPVGHVVRLLEAHGVLIARLGGASPRMDAMSRWLAGRPVVLLWDVKDNKLRSRFDASHELGHLLLHQDANEPDQLLERQASAFASALLMPAEAIEADLPRRPRRRAGDWAALTRARARWGVSIAALLYRARELGTLTESGFRRAMVELSSRGLRRDEGQDLGAPEQPGFLAALVRTYLADHGGDLDALAVRLHMGRRQLLEVLGPQFGESRSDGLVADGDQTVTLVPRLHRPRPA